MSYQVLARKWRPKTFAELAGQEHVVRALTHALEGGRLHHAYLLTGTRGVGKTTIARILAKSLNCEQGVSARPCGACAACAAIDAGRFVDLIELDAASNTGVDNMREILDNARYSPTAGRYKVYLIDEVHMLSRGAFNSMLKTLEEPPEHVKFVLATTDPQRIPVTVLSRCLQFGLKQLAPALISAQLERILSAEGIAFEPGALAAIARAARGSMRDALSLLDQAIAFGGGSLAEAAVGAMLGVVDRSYLLRLLEALAAGDGPGLMAEARAMAERSVALSDALGELAALLHAIALAQALPEAVSEDTPERGAILRLAGVFPPEDVQLYYQIAIQGRADMPLAPDEESGFTMALLRMLAFRPAETAPPSPLPGDPAPRAVRVAPAETSAERGAERGASPAQARPRAEAAAPPHEPAAPVGAPAAAVGAPAPLDWPALARRLPLAGMARQLAFNAELVRFEAGRLELCVPAPQKHLMEKPFVDKLRQALEEQLGRRIQLSVGLAAGSVNSIAEQERRDRQEQQARAQADFESDPFVQDALSLFGGRVKSETIKPVQ